MENKNDLSLFHHTIKEKVKFHEVDMMGVVNNAVYLNYFEDARVKYLQDLKIKYQLKEIMEGDSFFIMARIPGQIAHIYEEITREKPVRKIHPTDHEYDGPPEREIT